jgi:branched-chain amino acid transport system permease protein
MALAPSRDLIGFRVSRNHRESAAAYRIVGLSGRRSTPPRVVEDRTYPSANEAYNALFLRRVQDLMES